MFRLFLEVLKEFFFSFFILWVVLEGKGSGPVVRPGRARPKGSDLRQGVVEEDERQCSVPYALQTTVVVAGLRRRANASVVSR